MDLCARLDSPLPHPSALRRDAHLQRVSEPCGDRCSLGAGHLFVLCHRLVHPGPYRHHHPQQPQCDKDNHSVPQVPSAGEMGDRTLQSSGDEGCGLGVDQGRTNIFLMAWESELSVQMAMR